MVSIEVRTTDRRPVVSVFKTIIAGLRKAWRAVDDEMRRHERMTPQELRDDGWDIK